MAPLHSCHPILNMSEGRRICVCGKERGKEPVIITITTCKHKHTPRGEGSISVSPSPTNPTGSADADPKVDKSKFVQSGTKPSYSERTESEPDGGVKPDGDSELLAQDTDMEQRIIDEKTDLQPSEVAVNAKVIRSNTMYGKHVTKKISKRQIESASLEQQAEEVAQENETEPTENSPLTDIGQEEEAAPDSDAEQTVMMLREIAVNTVPFLENMFRVKSKSMPSFSEDQSKEARGCIVELFIFEKHDKNCKRNLKTMKNEGIFFDGDSVFGPLGRMSFATCAGENTNPSESEPLVSYLEGNDTPDLEERTKQCVEILKTIERYFRNQRLNENILPLDMQLQKYINLGKDSESKFNCNSVKFNTDRATQYERDMTSKIKRSRWYEALMMCFGIKDADDMYDTESKLKRQTISRQSSYLVCISLENEENEVPKVNVNDPTGNGQEGVAAPKSETEPMLIRETAVNTVPFLENMFTGKFKYMPSFPEDQRKKGSDCTVELFVYEKHDNNCKRNLKPMKNEGIFFEVDPMFEHIGRMSIATCIEGYTNESKSERLVAYLRGDGAADSEEKANQCVKILKTFETYLRSQQHRENILPLDIELQEYIDLEKDGESRNSLNFNTDRAAQYEEDITARIKRSKWNGLTMCFGIKDADDVYDDESIPKKQTISRESSYLITKYLKI